MPAVSMPAVSTTVACADTMRCVVSPPRPASRAPEPRRSLTPPTRRLSDVARLDAVRERLCLALRVANTLGDLRAHVAVLANDIEELVDEETAPATERPPATDPAPWEGACAPSTPRPTDPEDDWL